MGPVSSLLEERGLNGMWIGGGPWTGRERGLFGALPKPGTSTDLVKAWGAPGKLVTSESVFTTGSIFLLSELNYTVSKRTTQWMAMTPTDGVLVNFIFQDCWRLHSLLPGLLKFFLMYVSSFPAPLSGVAGPDNLSVMAWKCRGCGRLGCLLAFPGDSCLTSLQSYICFSVFTSCSESISALKKSEEVSRGFPKGMGIKYDNVLCVWPNMESTQEEAGRRGIGIV